MKFQKSNPQPPDLKKVVIINQDSGYLMIDIANALAESGCEVSILTGRLVVRNNPVASSVRTDKIVRYDRRNNFRRLLSWLIAFLQIIYKVKIKYRKDYLFIVSNPPLVAFLPLICRNRYSFMVFDIYPDTLTRMGILSESSGFIRFWRRINSKVFRRADFVFTLTESMALQIKGYNDSGNIKVIPVWSDNKLFRPVAKSENPFILQHELTGYFIVLYSGNLGSTHNIEIIPEIASQVTNTHILFLIIGDGERKKWIQDEIARRGLTNCKLLPLQPVGEIHNSFASGDVALIAQGAKSSGLSMPSKTFDYISAGLPLLCVAGEDSELHALVSRYGNGRSITDGQVPEMVEFLESLAEDEKLCDSYRTNSLSASRDFTSQNANKIADYVSGAINAKS